MSTEDVTDSIPHEDGERVLLLDGKDYVAVYIIVLRDKTHSELTVKSNVRAITKDGFPQVDSHGEFIQTWHVRSMFSDGLEDFDGISQLMLDCARIAVGDSDDETLGEVNDNIRRVLAAADAVALVHGDDSATADSDLAQNWKYTPPEAKS